MTADRSRPAAERPRSLQDDLLDDLRQAAPMPADRPTAPRQVIARTLPLSSPALPDRLPVLVRDVRLTPPTIELRLSSQSWSMPALRRRQGPPGLELSAGPIRLSLAYLGG